MILGPGGIVGDEDVVNRPSYTSTVRCLSQKGKVYELSRENFKLLFDGNTLLQLKFIENVVKKE